MTDLFYCRSIVDIERHRRISVALWAYAYEFENVSLVSDAKFDEWCLKVNRSIRTGHDVMDAFFCEGGVFDPCTGMWVHQHPELDKLAQLYARLNDKPVTTHTVLLEKKEPPLSVNTNMGLDTHIETKWYLASLGLNVVGHFSKVGERLCETTFDKDCGYIKDIQTGETKTTIFYKELF